MLPLSFCCEQNNSTGTYPVSGRVTHSAYWTDLSGGSWRVTEKSQVIWEEMALPKIPACRFRPSGLPLTEFLNLWFSVRFKRRMWWSQQSRLSWKRSSLRTVKSFWNEKTSITKVVLSGDKTIGRRFLATKQRIRTPVQGSLTELKKKIWKLWD